MTVAAIRQIMLDACRDAIIHVDPELRIEWANEAAARLLNLTKEEIIGRNCRELYADRLACCPNISCSKALKLKAPQNGVVRMSDERGREALQHYSVVPAMDESERVVGLTVITRSLSAKEESKYAAELAAREWTTAMDASDDAVYLLDPRLRLLRANRVFFQLTGMSPASALGRHIGEILHPQTGDRPCPVCQAQKEKRDEDIVLEPEDPNNVIGRPIEIKVRMVRDGEGEVVSIFMTLHDLSKQRRVENELREKRDRLALINNIQQSFLTSHGDNLYQEVLIHVMKDMGCRHGYFGYIDEENNLVFLGNSGDVPEPRKPAGKKLVIHRSEWRGEWGRSLLEKKSIYNNQGIELPTSRLEFATALMVPIFYKGEIVGQLTLANRKQGFAAEDVEKVESIAEQIAPILVARIQEDRFWKIKEESAIKLREAKEEWEQCFNAIGDVVTIQDSEMRIVRANRATSDLVGMPLGEIVGKYCFEVFCDKRHPCSLCPWLGTAGDSDVYSGIITHQILGKSFYVSMAPVYDDKGVVKYIVHTAKDVTDQKKMEEELFQAHKMEAIGTLAGGVAHDFNNILTVIIGYAELALDGIPAGSNREKDIKYVLNAASRAKELVQQILTFSRKGQEVQKPLHPAPIVKEALKLLRATLPSTVELREEIDSDCGRIVANPTYIHQVLVNLCTNALHALENEKGILTVKLARVELRKPKAKSGGTFVELMVSDTGQGMDKGIIEHIFEPYFTTKGIGKGSGMGLSLVHGIVLNCGGFIKVESEPGKGSKFHVYFPAMEKETAMIRKEERETISLSGGDERILIVDDEEIIADMYKTALGQLGYKVTINTSSETAFDDFQAAPDDFDLIITDQTMPNLTGSDLARKILAVRPDIPIILCTGYSAMVSEEKANEMGIAKFLMKPFSIQTLTGAVREVLNKKRS